MKYNVKIIILILIVYECIGCNSSLKTTFVGDLSNDPLSLNLNGAIKLTIPNNEVYSTQLFKTDAFLVKNYKDNGECGDKIYNYAKANWKKYSMVYKKYEVTYLKESKLVNLHTIHEIHGYDMAALNSINHATIVKYRFVKDSITVEKFNDGRLVSTSKHKI